jgi:ferritin
MKKEITSALNDQINAELSSAYKYLAMSTYFEAKSLSGFAHWMRLQADEELSHAKKIIHYLLDRGEQPEYQKLPAPTNTYKGPLAAFEASLAQEIALQEAFEAMSQLARKSDDATTWCFLEWFLMEQVEEIASCGAVIDKLKLIGDNGSGLLLLDSELSQRKAGA